MDQQQQLAVEDGNWILKIQNTAVIDANQDPGLPHLLKSSITPAKELDCLLIYDPETDEYVLERQHSSFNFQRVRKDKDLKKESMASPTSPLETTANHSDVFDLEEEDFEDLDQIVADTITENVVTSDTPNDTPNDGPRPLFEDPGTLDLQDDDDASSSVAGE